MSLASGHPKAAGASGIVFQCRDGAKPCRSRWIADSVPRPMETSLYLPVKAFLEQAGYTVKGEIGGCDIVGLSDQDPPVVVICELKMSFNLELILQAVDRAAVADEVWIAARISAKGKGRESDKRYRDLCRRLGIGMLGVADNGEISVIVGSVTPMPRTNPKRRSRLMREHQKRRGDPVVGGSTRVPQMTAYRQQALGLRGRPCLRPAQGQGYPVTGSGRRKDPALECLWLVRAARPGRLSADPGRTGGAFALAPERSRPGAYALRVNRITANSNTPAKVTSEDTATTGSSAGLPVSIRNSEGAMTRMPSV